MSLFRFWVISTWIQQAAPCDKRAKSELGKKASEAVSTRSKKSTFLQPISGFGPLDGYQVIGYCTQKELQSDQICNNKEKGSKYLNRLRVTEDILSSYLNLSENGLEPGLFDKTTVPPWPRESLRYSVRSGAG